MSPATTNFAEPISVADLAAFAHLRRRSDVAWECGENRPYGSLAAETIDYFRRPTNSAISADRTELPEPFHHRKSLNGRFGLWGHQWRISAGAIAIGVARMVIIQGQKNEIINTWLFPKYPISLPVFAAELISMGGQQRLSFIDVQTPGFNGNKQQLCSAIQQNFEQHRNLRIDEMPPAWAVSDTLGFYIFRRTGGEQQFSEICRCYMDYLTTCIDNAWLDLVAAMNFDADSQAIAANARSLQALHDYQLHHMHSSPGNAFLAKLFGENWTESFLHEFLFSKP